MNANSIMQSLLKHRMNINFLK